MTTVRAAFASLAALLVAAGEPPGRGPAADPLKGVWAAQSVTIHGVRQPDDPTRGAVRMAFDGRTYLQMAGERLAEEGTYEVGPAADPGEIDLVISQGPAAGKRQLGVYRITGDTLTLVLAEPGARRRPKSVETRAEAVVVLKKLTR